MIRNNAKKEKTLDPLEKIQSSPFTFHLTGSRFFDMATEYSDWDVFCQDAPEVVAWLENQGFHQIYAGNYYTDANCVSTFSSGNVHVQMVKDVDAKLKVQNNLKEAGLGILLTNKTRSKKLWSFGYAMIDRK